MVNNSTNINKMSKTSELIKHKKTMTYHIWTLGIQVLAWDRYKNRAGLNQSMGSNCINWI